MSPPWPISHVQTSSRFMFSFPSFRSFPRRRGVHFLAQVVAGANSWPAPSKSPKSSLAFGGGRGHGLLHARVEEARRVAARGQYARAASARTCPPVRRAAAASSWHRSPLTVGRAHRTAPWRCQAKQRRAEAGWGIGRGSDWRVGERRPWAPYPATRHAARGFATSPAAFCLARRRKNLHHNLRNQG